MCCQFWGLKSLIMSVMDQETEPTRARQVNISIFSILFGYVDIIYKHKQVVLMPQAELKNIRGGGLHYVADWKSPQMRLFKAGLKQDPLRLENLTKGLLNRPTMEHDKLNYDRGSIKHARSPHNQYFLFHYMYGGFKKFVIDRWFIGHFYKRTVRILGLPVALAYALGCWGMRRYDNNSYKFFYFSD